MKKLGIIALLGIFLFNTAGYYLVYLAERMEIKNEIRSEINAGNYDRAFTSVITINKADPAKIELSDDGSEVRYNDAMYDVVKTTETANEISYYCINDSKENSLFATLNDHISTHIVNKPIKDHGAKKISDDIVKIWFPADNTFNFNQSVDTLTPIPVVADCLSAEKQKSTPPPPEFC
ncbi:MAG: hypothetical protein ACJ77K_13580 [Bacteroidia bacterium]